jgi:hypothetical protein
VKRALAVRCFGLLVAGLGATWLAVCGGDHPCVPSQCSSGALMTVPLTVSAAALSGTSVSVCRNAECYTAALPDVPAPASGGASIFFKDVSFVWGTISQAANLAIELDLEWHLDASQLQDGDHYVVTLTNPASIATVVLDKTATYSALAPLPGECAGSAGCSIAELTP